MALRAFHNNPGIGGFGESTPVLFDDAIDARKRNERRQRQKQSKETPSSSNDNHQVSKRSSRDGDRNSEEDGNATREYNNGDGDLLCQIIKELVDNAVDACRNSCSEYNNEHNKNQAGSVKRRIRVDIRPPTSGGFNDNFTAASSSKARLDDVLQVTVSDNGCGMENIQNCVNAFQSSKDGGQVTSNNNNSSSSSNNGNSSGNGNNHTSGRYGIGLTLCLLHAQRCVPNSRACISSATSKSKYRIRAFFEVDKQGDSVDCVQEEVTNSTTSEQESGTCVSLLVPGGIAGKLAWPRLHDYFTRFRLCTKLHFELDVFAPTLSKLPIFIRPVPSGQRTVEDTVSIGKGERARQQQHLNVDDHRWGDLLDDDDDDEGGDDNSNDKYTIERKEKSNKNPDTNASKESDLDRYAFYNAAKSFWPKRNIAYDNVARSIRNIRNHKQATSAGVGKKGKSELQLEVHMVVCPHSRQDDKINSSTESTATATSSSSSSYDDDNEISTDYAVGDGQIATLQLIRMVNGVPILDSAEAHSCGLVHGVANKVVWGSFGLDVDRSAAMAPDTTSSHHTTPCTPSFHLRDSNLIAPFINRNLNHRQLQVRNQEDTINYDNDYDAENKKRKRQINSQNDLLPANVRIGTILVVVQIRAAPSSLPLPTLSKGRLPLNHQPIDSTLQLGLRDCLVSLQSTNPTLFLTTTQLRTVEREVRHIPGIASAVSRIVCRSGNQSLRQKSMELFRKVSSSDKIRQEQTAGKQYISVESMAEEQERGGNDVKIDVSSLAHAFESQLRLAMRARNELMNIKRSKKQRATIAMDKEEEYHDFDSDDESKSGMKSWQPSIANNTGSLSLSASPCEPSRLEMESATSFNSPLSQRVLLQPRRVEDSSEESTLPVKEVLIERGSDLVMNENENDFDDWW